MMQVATPVAGFTGEVAGVQFVDGVGETSDPRSLAYFSRHGYQLGDAPAPSPVVEEQPAPVEETTDTEEPGVEEQPAPRGRRRS